MLPNKPYRGVIIRECGEKLVQIPRDLFCFYEPHPYVALGAPYGGASPWMARSSVVNALCKAQAALQSLKPEWRILLFDAYRPNSVQAFMVERELVMLAREAGLDPVALTIAEHESLYARVMRLFAPASDDPSTPPPHSTGAAIDCTLADAQNKEVDMGSPIDENSDLSHPNFFSDAKNDVGKAAHANRTLLNEIMTEVGFRRNPNEWWHFSMGDQLAIWIDRDVPGLQMHAIYGRADLIL